MSATPTLLELLEECADDCDKWVRANLWMSATWGPEQARERAARLRAAIVRINEEWERWPAGALVRSALLRINAGPATPPTPEPRMKPGERDRATKLLGECADELESHLRSEYETSDGELLKRKFAQSVLSRIHWLYGPVGNLATWRPGTRAATVSRVPDLRALPAP